MSLIGLLELAAALALIGFGILSYRRGGTQGGVITLIIGAVVLIHALGLMDYRPSPAELAR